MYFFFCFLFLFAMFANPRFLSGRQTRGHPAALACQVAYKVHAVLLIHAGSLRRAKQTVSFFPRSYLPFYHTRSDVSFAPTEKTRAKQQSQCKSKKRSKGAFSSAIKGGPYCLPPHLCFGSLVYSRV